MYDCKVVIIGGSRGIGLELAKQLQQVHHGKPNAVLATMRNPTRQDGLSDEIAIEALNVTDALSIKSFAEKVHSIDTLIVNAVVGEPDNILTTDAERLQWYMDNNVFGIHNIVQALLPALLRGAEKKLVYISSISASMQRQIGAPRGLGGPYSVSKAAAQMLFIQYYNALRPHRVAVALIHPGWVATDLGKQAGDGGMPVEESVAGIVRVVENDVSFGTGPLFVDWRGERVPW